MVSLIDANRDEFGVEPNCSVLHEDPSTRSAAKPRKPSARAIMDAVTPATAMTVFKANYSIYGVDKMWKALQRAGENIGRDQVARIMRGLGIAGARRGGKVFTTRPDDKAVRPPDLVERNFVANAPNRLGVMDLTYVPIWLGMAYACFVADVFSRTIMGWRAAGNMRTDTVLDSLQMTRFNRGTRLDGLICHTDAGSQFTSVRWSERLNEVGARLSIGTVANSYDNAPAETVNGLFKTEPTQSQAPWRTVEDVGLDALGQVVWINNTRLKGMLGDISPDEFEATYYDQTVSIS